MGKELPQGYRLGNYSIERLVQRDGLKQVYAALASDPQSGAPLPCRLVVFAVDPDSEAWQRFSSEQSQLAALAHPTIAKSIEVAASPDGLAYAVWQQPVGEDLASRLRRGGALTLRESLALARQVAAALQAAHRLDILHRDLTPENIYFVKQPSDASQADHEPLLVYGFGLARLFEATLSGLGIYGHPEYMAPEQISGLSFEIGPATDQYALALLIYQSLSASQPFRADSPGAALLKVVRSSPEHMRALRPDLPSHVDSALARGLAKESRSRFADLLEFVSELSGDEKLPASLLLHTESWLTRSAESEAAVGRARQSSGSVPSLGTIAQGMADAGSVPQVVEDQATVPNTMEHVMRLAVPPEPVRTVASGPTTGPTRERSEPIEISLDGLDLLPASGPHGTGKAAAAAAPKTAGNHQPARSGESRAVAAPSHPAAAELPSMIVSSPPATAAAPPSTLAKLLPPSLVSLATPIERGIFLAIGLLLGFLFHALLK
jgi:serine/threonine-protein kinase